MFHVLCRVQKIYDLQMNVNVNGRGGRVHITEVVDDVKQVTFVIINALTCSLHQMSFGVVRLQICTVVLPVGNLFFIVAHSVSLKFAVGLSCL